MAGRGRVRRRRRFLFGTCASTFLLFYSSLRAQVVASFQVHRVRVQYSSSPIRCNVARSPLTLRTPRKCNSSKKKALFSEDNGSNVFNENAILGETVDVDLRDGTYSWSNPKAQRSKLSWSTDVPSGKDRYTRIPFDGCGSILLHHQPRTNNRPRRTGVTLWSASYVISYYIDAQWSKGGPWHRGNTGVNSTCSWTVLELGAGLGLCSSVAAKHGMNVVSTDNDPAVLRLLKENLQRNRIYDIDSFETTQYQSSANNPSKKNVKVESLDWVAVANDPQAETAHPVFLQLESHGGADLILLSDVIYGATQPAWNALVSLLSKFRAQRRRIHMGQQNENEDNDPLVLLGYTQRRRDMSPKDEARFFALVQAAGMETALVPSARIPNGDKYLLTSLFQLRWID